jgi:hypothetical protein
MIRRMVAVLMVAALMVVMAALPALAQAPQAGPGLATAACAQDAAGPSAAECPKPAR